MDKTDVTNICLIAQGILIANKLADKYPEALAEAATKIYLNIIKCAQQFNEST